MHVVSRLLRAGSALFAALPVVACLHVPPGATILTVETDDPKVEQAVRPELWRVERAVEAIKIRYGLTDIGIEVVVTDLGGLGETRPALDERLGIEAAVVSLHERLFLDGHPDLDDILVGLLAHELVHGLQEARASRGDLAVIGFRYERFLLEPANESLREWVMHFEQLTDMTAIAHGYAEELVHQKRASAENLARNHPKHVWDFYLGEDEIRALAADPESLRARMEAALIVVNLRSVEAWARPLARGDPRSTGAEE